MYRSTSGTSIGRRASGLLLLAATALVTAVPASGQQHKPTGDTTRVYNLEALVVVGRNEAVQTSSFLQKALAAQPAGVNALEALNRAPGFNFTAGDANGFYEYGQNIRMRVFNATQLGFTVDGIPLGSQGPAGGTPAGRIVENESVEQVTVHQGSGNIETVSSFGLGGSVVYNTTAPRAERGGRMRLTGGQFGTRRGYFRYDTGELAEGLTSYVSVSRNVFDKWRSKGDQRRLHVESKLRQDFSTGHVSLNAYYNKRDDHDFLDVSIDDFKTYGRDLDLSEQYVVMSDKVAQADANALFWDAWSNGRDDLLLGVDLDARPSDRLSFRVTPYFQNQSGVGTWLPDYRPDASAADPLAAENRDQTRNTWRESQYFLTRFGGTGTATVGLGTGNTLTFGTWAEHYERTFKRVWFDIPDQNRYDPQTIREQVVPYWTQFDRNYEIDTYSAFAKAQFRLASTLQLSAGVRAQGYSVSYFDDLNAEGRSFDDGIPFLPQVGFVFDAAREHQIFGSLSRNFSQVPDDAVRQNAGVDGEKSVNVDLGYRFLHPGRTLSLAGYFIRYTDKIESIQLGPYDRYANESALQNVGGIDALGAEVTGDFALGSGLGLFTSVSVAHSVYQGDVVDASEEGGVLHIDGNDAVFTPRVQGFGELTYRAGDLTLSVNGKYVGSRKASLSGPVGGDPSAQETLDSYVLAGFGATYDLGRVALSLSGSNLTDTRYLASTSGIGPGTSRHPGGGTYFPGSPRWITFGVDVPF